jgi:uncharacterized protein YbaP (TraB family)
MRLLFWSKEKPLRMVWRLEKNGRTSHLVGTAHFFPYSFRRTLTRLIRNSTAVMFEGPLDDASFERIAEYGGQGDNIPTFLDALTPEAIAAIDRILCNRVNSHSSDPWLFPMAVKNPVYLEAVTRGVRPWAAFFSIWRTYLDWKYSVDLEADRIASTLGRQIHFLETLDEQLAVLDNIPLDRIARQLNDVKNWSTYKKDYVKTYLSGDLEKMMALTARFATRTPATLGARDRILFDRMLRAVEHQNTLAFIGFPHVPGVTTLFRDSGYAVTQVCV